MKACASNPAAAALMKKNDFCLIGQPPAEAVEKR
jgi:hypothetical protein